MLSFLSEVVKYRLDCDLKNQDAVLPDSDEIICRKELRHFVDNNQLNYEELVLLLLALIPHISPEFFTNIIAEYLPNGGDLPEFGGVKGKNHRGILPTGETVLFILAGRDLEKRMEIAKLFDEEHLFAQKSVLYIEQVPAGEPKMSGRLIMDEEYVDLFISGKLSRPKLSSDFPAQRISTNLEWSDLVLKDKILDEIKELETWLNYNERLMTDWGMRDKLKPGFRVLFYGLS